MLPQQWLSDWKWQALLDALQGDWQWLEHLSNLLYALVLVVWEPVYVACGFTLYLNRRTELEAWDIELVFRTAEVIHVLRYGAVLASGTPDEIRGHPDVIEAYLGRETEEEPA